MSGGEEGLEEGEGGNAPVAHEVNGMHERRLNIEDSLAALRIFLCTEKKSKREDRRREDHNTTEWNGKEVSKSQKIH